MDNALFFYFDKISILQQTHAGHAMRIVPDWDIFPAVGRGRGLPALDPFVVLGPGLPAGRPEGTEQKPDHEETETEQYDVESSHFFT